MDINPYDRASVQYDDWTGSIAGDEADMQHWEKYLGIDEDRWRLLHLIIAFSGGSQWITPYVVSAQTSYEDLQRMVDSDNPIRLTRLEGIEYHYPGEFDTNPPRPSTIPVVSATDFLGHAFKRLEIKLTFRHIPEGATFEEVEISE